MFFFDIIGSPVSSSDLTVRTEAEEMAVPATVGITVTDRAPDTPISWKTTICLLYKTPDNKKNRVKLEEAVT